MSVPATISQALTVLQGNLDTRVPGLRHKVGRRFLQADRGGNTVVWVPLRDTFEPGRQQPGVRRVSRVRVTRFEVHLWGVPSNADGTLVKRGVATPSDGWDSIAQADRMLLALACALEDSAKACQYELEEGSWEDVTGDSVSEYGLEYVALISLRIPVVYDAYFASPVTGQSITGTFEALDGDDTSGNPPP